MSSISIRYPKFLLARIFSQQQIKRTANRTHVKSKQRAARNEPGVLKSKKAREKKGHIPPLHACAHLRAYPCVQRGREDRRGDIHTVESNADLGERFRNGARKMAHIEIRGFVSPPPPARRNEYIRALKWGYVTFTAVRMNASFIPAGGFYSVYVGPRISINYTCDVMMNSIEGGGVLVEKVQTDWMDRPRNGCQTYLDWYARLQVSPECYVFMRSVGSAH